MDFKKKWDSWSKFQKGFLIFSLIIALGIVAGNQSSVTKKQPTKITEKEKEINEKAKELSLELQRKKCEKAFKTFSSQRFFKELNCDDPKSLDGVFQIDNSLFKLIPYQQKKDLGKLTYECCGEKNIKFVDYYSGRTVATYTYFSGFKLKD